MSNENETTDTAERSGSSDARLVLTLDRGAIAAKTISWVSGGVIGCSALMTDGSWRLFAVTEEPTHQDFYGLDESIRSLPLEERRLMVFQATGLDEDDELPWLEYDSTGEPVSGHAESDLLNAWLDETIDLTDEQYESWGSRTASEFAPGFEILGLLSDEERAHLGLRELDRGGPASSVPCVGMAASIQQFNQLMEARGLPYVIVDDEGTAEA